MCFNIFLSVSSSVNVSTTPVSLPLPSPAYVNMLGNNNATMPCYLRYGIETEAETHHTQTHQHPNRHTHTHGRIPQWQIENEMRGKQQQWQ